MAQTPSDTSGPDPALNEEKSTENEETQTKAENAESPDKTKEPSRMKKLWDKAGLDWQTVKTMAKAGLAPTIALAFYQSTAVADLYTTLGYLVAIATILSVPIMPRAKFIETMIFNVLSVCLGAAVSLLALWTAVKARENTQSAADGYNSSASAVCAIWLVFEIYVINSMRSYRPQYVFPGILTSIFAVVSLSYGPNFTTMAQCISFARRLLEAFLTGFAIATGVSLFIFPVSSRQVVFKEMTGYLGALRGLAKAQCKYIQSLENIDMFLHPVPEAKAVKGAVAGLKALQGKLAMDIPFAKRDFAYGHLTAHDISEIARHLRQILLPMVGMTSLIDILKRVGDLNGWNKSDSTEEEGVEPLLEENEQRAVRDWQNLVRTLHEPFHTITEDMDQAIDHILLTLEFKPRPKKTKKNSSTTSQADDVEATGDAIRPGDPKFSLWYEAKIDQFYNSREASLREWCKLKKINIPAAPYQANVEWSARLERASTQAQRDQRQLLIFLYIEWLLWSTSTSVLELVRFADSKVSDGTMKNKHFIFPGKRRLRKWIMSSFQHQGMSNDEHFDVPTDSAEQDIYFGEALRTKKDPEHLPPTNWWQKTGNWIRTIPQALRSPHSIFGFRVACAVMSIAIVSYLHDTHAFFLEQRLFWSEIMIAISMNRLAGQSLFGFAFRVLGTFVAMCATFVIYYVPDGHPAGVLVFEYIWICLCFYVVVKYPKFIIVGMICSVTSVLIIGYTLQVDKIGVVLSTSNYQAYYPIYELGPYRLATVAGGLFVAFIWTIFPYPITEHSEIRRELGMTLYLLANHYTIVHETIGSRVRADEGDPHSKTSPARRLEKARMDIYMRSNVVIARLKQNSGFSSWQVRLGGKFPSDLYNSCIACAESILSYAALLSFSSRTFTKNGEENSAWQKDFAILLGSLQTTSMEITTRLCLLSNSITNGIPLPPHLQPIEPYGLLNRLEKLDKDILGVNHMTEPGYAAFAVMQIGSRSIIADVNTLTHNVRQLVGELDFSFHSVSKQSTPSTSEENLNGKVQKHD